MTPFTNILFVANPSQSDSATLHQAIELAENNQAKLTIVGLAEVSERQKAASDSRTKQLLESIIEQRQEQLQSLVRDASSRSHGPVDVKVLIGRGFMEVIRAVLRHQFDLVIKGAEIIGGVAEPAAVPTRSFYDNVPVRSG